MPSRFAGVEQSFAWCRIDFSGFLQGVATKGHNNDPRAGTPLLGGRAGRAGAAQPGEEKAAGRP